MKSYFHSPAENIPKVDFFRLLNISQNPPPQTLLMPSPFSLLFSPLWKPSTTLTQLSYIRQNSLKTGCRAPRRSVSSPISYHCLHTWTRRDTSLAGRLRRFAEPQPRGEMRQGVLKATVSPLRTHHTHECLQHPGPGAQTIRWKSNAFQIRLWLLPGLTAREWEEKSRLRPTQPSRKHPSSQANLGQVIWRLRGIKAIYQRGEGGRELHDLKGANPPSENYFYYCNSWYVLALRPQPGLERHRL